MINLQDNSNKILKYLYNKQKDLKDEIYVSSRELGKETGLNPTQVNDAVGLLCEANFAKSQVDYPPSQYTFSMAIITNQGKLEIKKRRKNQVASLHKETSL